MAMNRFIEVVKQYPGQQQVDLSVEIEVPGNWFGGSLTSAEKREKYKAQAVEFAWLRWAEVGCAKAASANVEVVFSGAGRMH